ALPRSSFHFGESRMTCNPPWVRTKVIPSSPPERLMVQLSNLFVLKVVAIAQGPTVTGWLSRDCDWASPDVAASLTCVLAILAAGGGGSRTSHWQIRKP